jgi:phosphoribosylformylglycinamidine synthase II
MLWEVDILPRDPAQDAERARVEAEYALWGLSPPAGGRLLLGTSHGYILEGELSAAQLDYLQQELFVDPLVERAEVRTLPAPAGSVPASNWTVLLKPGVMDPVAQSVREAAQDLGILLDSVRTFRRYRLLTEGLPSSCLAALRKLLANEAIEQIVAGPLQLDHLALGRPYRFQRLVVPLRQLDDAALEQLSRDGQLALSLAEIRAIQEHFRALGRDPTDVELETLAQTWSEHCSHKTLKGQIYFQGRHYRNLLQETIFAATQEIRRRLGPDDWCVSVFEDNAGVVRFTDQYHICFKVETHNHPSAIEPYGGANTGLGGVIRDSLGTGLGAKPIANTDVFCFAPPWTGPQSRDAVHDLPPGVLPPLRLLTGVVAGVRDYGNRMGIPTVNGAVCFHPRYLANPLVYCGTVGLLPVDRCQKAPQPGDWIVVIGGRTGRDGIHGATFSSLQLSADSEKVSGQAVQIGNAITEKKLLDVLLQARDRDLYHAITDCGAGGFSSAIGEMAARLGAEVHLDKAPLKYEGLSYTEIWISESQERMILAVPPAHWPELSALCAQEEVEAAILGRFEASGRLRLFYQDHLVADLDLEFLHHGRPPVVRQAAWTPPSLPPAAASPATPPDDYAEVLLRLLASWNICSKEWIIRQYDHEVQGGTVLKPLVGAHEDGPGDAAVLTPVLGSWVGIALGCGLNPYYGDLDPYRMAAACIDEAVRNVVAVGADPARIALLDNFCWGDTDRPEVLGSLVLAAEACRDISLAWGMPFISGKDSLKNEYQAAGTHLAIPPTLLISALGRVPDVRRCVSMDLKEPGDRLYLLGVTRPELGGSHYHLVCGLQGGEVPRVEPSQALRLFQRLHQAISQGLVRACHDLSEGGLAVALAEMAFAGDIGAEITQLAAVASGESETVCLFSESPSRFLVEVAPESAPAFEQLLADLPCTFLGCTCAEPVLRIQRPAGGWLLDLPLTQLKEAWQRPLRF